MMSYLRSMIDLTIIVPVFNEERTIIKLLREIKKQVKTSNEVIIVYDFEKDPTVNVVKKYLQRLPNKNIRLLKNNTDNKKGVINAIKSAINASRGQAIVMVAADLTDNLSTIDRLYAKLEEGYDIVGASRYMKGGKKIGGPFIKTLLSKYAGLSLNNIFRFPIHDATNAFKIYRKTIFKKIPIVSTGGFEYSLEITIKAYKQGYRITEIPTRWIDRIEGKSNFRLWRWLPKYIKTYLLIITYAKTPFNIKWKAWSSKVRKNISNLQLILTLIISFIFSTLIYLVLIKLFNLKFVVQSTTAINWLTVNHYPKQQDYYLFYSMFCFVFIFTLSIWLIWINLKLKE